MKKSLTLLGALFLVLAISSGAFAAKGLLTGAQIKNHSLTGVDIKKRSLGAALLTPSAKKSLQGLRGSEGAQGPGGAAGPIGLAGNNGAVGASGTNGVAGTNGLAGLDGTNGTDGINGTDGTNGTVTPLSATAAGPTVLPALGPPIVVVFLDVPAGNYVVLAKTQLFQSGAGDAIECVLKAGNTTLDQVAMKTLPALAEIPVSLQAVTTVNSPSQLSVECDMRTAVGTASSNSLIAIPTS